MPFPVRLGALSPELAADDDLHALGAVLHDEPGEGMPHVKIFRKRSIRWHDVLFVSWLLVFQRPSHLWHT